MLDTLRSLIGSGSTPCHLTNGFETAPKSRRFAVPRAVRAKNRLGHNAPRSDRYPTASTGVPSGRLATKEISFRL
jgi:hypothetical protein